MLECDETQVNVVYCHLYRRSVGFTFFRMSGLWTFVQNFEQRLSSQHPALHGRVRSLQVE